MLPVWARMRKKVICISVWILFSLLLSFRHNIVTAVIVTLYFLRFFGFCFHNYGTSDVFATVSWNFVLLWRSFHKVDLFVSWRMWNSSLFGTTFRLAWTPPYLFIFQAVRLTFCMYFSSPHTCYISYPSHLS